MSRAVKPKSKDKIGFRNSNRKSSSLDAGSEILSPLPTPTITPQPPLSPASSHTQSPKPPLDPHIPIKAVENERALTQRKQPPAKTSNQGRRKPGFPTKTSATSQDKSSSVKSEAKKGPGAMEDLNSKTKHRNSDTQKGVTTAQKEELSETVENPNDNLERDKGGDTEKISPEMEVFEWFPIPETNRLEYHFTNLPLTTASVQRTKELFSDRHVPYFYHTYFYSHYSSREITVLWNTQLDKVNYHDVFMKVWNEYSGKYELEDSISMGNKLSDIDMEFSETRKLTFEKTPLNFAFYTFNCAVSTVWNLSDESPSACRKIWKEERLVGEMLRDLQLMIPKYREEDNWCIDAFIGIIHNILRHVQEKGEKFRELGGTEIVAPLLSSTNDYRNVIGAFILAYGLNEEQLKKQEGLKELVPVIVSVVRMGAQSRDRRYNGMSVHEALCATNKLAVQEAIQEAAHKTYRNLKLDDEDKAVLQRHHIQLSLLEKPQLSIFLAILNGCYVTKERIDELREITQLFWTLSFNDKAKSAFKEHVPSLVSTLKNFCEHEDTRVAKAAQGVLWKVEGVRQMTAHTRLSSADKNKQLSESGAQKGHIMISYDWHHKEIALAINKTLKSLGFTIWIDVEQMSGSTLSAMAEAVEQASLMLLCFSERYKESPNCRAEAEYAFQKRIPIVPIRTQSKYRADGWLGILLGSKFFLNCFHPDGIPDVLQRIVHEINSKLGGGTGKHEVARKCSPKGRNPSLPKDEAEEMEPSSDIPKLPSIASSDGIATGGPLRRSLSLDSLAEKKSELVHSWNKEHVQRWFRKQNLKQLGRNFADFDGKGLAQLKSLYQRHHPTFTHVLKTLRIKNVRDIVLLSAALETL